MIVSQKTLRADLVTKLKTITLLADDTDHTAHVVGYFPTNPAGISPLVGIDSAGAMFDLVDDDTNQTPMRFVIGVWVRRDDPATAEDQINDLAASIATVLALNYNAKFTTHPQSDFEEIEGIQYKFELHFVEIQN
jgi:hypothetical protein